MNVPDQNMALEVPAQASSNASSKPVFAMQQSNKAIKILLHRSAGNAADLEHTRLVLTSCILFAYIEAWLERPGDSRTHVLQGRRLVEHCERTNLSSEEDSRPCGVTGGSPAISVITLKSMLELMESLSRALEQEPRLPADELPDEVAMSNLEEALRIFWTIFNAFMHFLQDNYTPMMSDDAEVRPERKRFLQLLERWEADFFKLLLENHDRMSRADRRCAMVLKANHLFASILASGGTGSHTSKHPFSGFESDFQDIVDLGDETLKHQGPSALPVVTDPRLGWLKFNVGIYGPLYFTLARCPDSRLRRRAARMLIMHWRVGGKLGTPPDDAVVDGWMQSSAAAPIDAGLSVFGCRTDDNVPPDALRWMASEFGVNSIVPTGTGSRSLALR